MKKIILAAATISVVLVASAGTAYACRKDEPVTPPVVETPITPIPTPVPEEQPEVPVETLKEVPITPVAVVTPAPVVEEAPVYVPKMK